MSLQLATLLRNAMADAIETYIGVSAILKLRTGAPPANCGTADSGTVIATLNLPSDWMTAAASGTKGKNGTWQDASADSAGTVGHFRLYDSGGATCVMQGTVTATGGGGDMTVDNTVLAAGQPFSITQFDITIGGA